VLWQIYPNSTLTGADFKQKLLLVPNADTNPEIQHEISEPTLLTILLDEINFEKFKEAEIPAMLDTLNCINKLSNITEVEIHQSSMSSVTDGSKAFHVFIVFKTSRIDGDYWWSLEKNTKYIVMQRSRNKNDVKDKLYGEKRNNVKAKAENLAGKGTIQDLFIILWAYEVLSEKYHIVNSNCQSLVTLVSNKFTEIGYEFKGYFKYSPQENDRNVEMLDFFNNILSNSFKGLTNILYFVVKSKNTLIFDKFMESGKYNIDDPLDPRGTTLLHFVITSSSPEMVRHLLEKWKADPTKRDRLMGMNALHAATFWANDNIIEYSFSQKTIDLFLDQKQVNINERVLCKMLDLINSLSNSFKRDTHFTQHHFGRKTT
jgi:hypothetical protein